VRTYQRKRCQDGTLNPEWKPDTRKGDRHKARKRRGPRSFVALDGEAIEGDYCILASSRGRSIVHRDGLSTTACLEFILGEAAREPGAVLAGFVFSYDANMILHELPEPKIRALWDNGQCWWNGYVLTYRHRKEFRIRAGERRATVWDTFGFFQSSFVKALESWNVGTPGELAAMKARRATFQKTELWEVLGYCRQECRDLETMLDELERALVAADIRLARFDGAGAVAAALMRREGVKNHMPGRQVRKLRDAARSAYYGGRIECVRFGTVPGAVYAYDLRSAYPAALRTAPCLSCGHWTRENETGPLSLARVRWKLAGNVLPFPWRAYDGTVFFPQEGEGWYWSVELDAARAALATGVITGRLDVSEVLTFHPECDHAPFGWLDRVYAQRAEYKAQGHAAEKPLKLGLNSLYGKTAQRVGWKGKRPAYHALEWAGLTTARTRAELYRASLPAASSGALLFYATDAIVTTVPLELPAPVDDRPGGWESAEHDGATIVQSGVYWLEHRAKTRGFFPGEVTEAGVRHAWARGQWTLLSRSERFVSMGQALRSSNFATTWRTWSRAPRRLALHPIGTKRDLESGARLHGRGRIRPELGLIATRPADPARWREREAFSTPLVFAWHDDGFDPAADYADRIVRTETEDGHL
jgi:hypothetical protein